MTARDHPKRQRSHPIRRTIIAGLLVMPIVIVLTFGALVLTSQAMFGAPAPALPQPVMDMMVRGGLVLVSPTASPPPTRLPPSPPPTAYVPPASGGSAAESASDAGLNDTATPTATDTPTPSATPSVTPTASATATQTSTPSATASATWTATPSLTPSLTPTRTWTATRRPTRTPSRTPRPPTSTVKPSATASPSGPSPTPGPSETPTEGPSPTASSTATPVPSATPSACTIVLNTDFEAQVASLVNGARRDNGLAVLTVQSQLRAAARVQATDMACNHFTGHTGSDGSTVRDRVEAQGYSWSWIGENYYVTHDTVTGPQTAFNWWMNSTPHRENILGSAYTQFGVGYVFGPDSDYGGYFVVVFARPK